MIGRFVMRGVAHCRVARISRLMTSGIVFFASILALSVSSAHSLGAQTRFQWPAPTMDLTQYTTVEACLAATERLRDSVEGPQRAQITVSAFNAATTREAGALPAVVITEAQRCSAQWPSQSANLDDYRPLLTLYLQAGRDTDARTLIQRRLAAPDAAADSVKAAVIDAAAENYVLATPARVADAEHMLDQFATLPKTGDRLFQQMFGWHMVQTASDFLGDTARARRAAAHMPELAAALTPEDKESVLWQLRAKYWTYQAYEYLNWFTALDRLRTSTASYVSLMRDSWAKASNEHQRVVQFPLGNMAAPVEGEFWFMPSSGTGPSVRVSAPTPTRPTRGKIALVVFFDGCIRSSSECWDIDATLRRLHQHYPDVELTLIGQTFGFVLDQVPPPPDQEAELYRQWWLEFQHIPAALAVSVTPFTRVEDPDRRRINQATANQLHYSTASWPSSMKGYLIDRDGTIIYADTVHQRSEKRFSQLIDVLQGAGRGQGRQANKVGLSSDISSVSNDTR